MKNNIINFSLSLLLGLGTILLFSPFALYWWIHGDYDRYLWIINGPYPYSSFGGGPFQLVMGLGLFLCGIVLIVVYFIGRKLYSKSRDKKESVGND